MNRRFSFFDALFAAGRWGRLGLLSVGFALFVLLSPSFDGSLQDRARGKMENSGPRKYHSS